MCSAPLISTTMATASSIQGWPLLSYKAFISRSSFPLSGVTRTFRPMNGHTGYGESGMPNLAIHSSYPFNARIGTQKPGRVPDSSVCTKTLGVPSSVCFSTTTRFPSSAVSCAQASHCSSNPKVASASMRSFSLSDVNTCSLSNKLVRDLVRPRGGGEREGEQSPPTHPHHTHITHTHTRAQSHKVTHTRVTRTHKCT